MRLKASGAYSFGESNTMSLEDAAESVCRDFGRDLSLERTAQAFARLVNTLHSRGLLSSSEIEQVLNYEFQVVEGWADAQMRDHGKLG
jgi:hypothetical protein